MAFQFPWTNLHELNLDWFLSKFKQFTNNYLETTATVELIPTTEQPEVTVTGGTLDDDTDIVDPFTFNFKLPINSSGGGAVDSVNGKVGTVVLDKTDIGLGNVANVAQYSASNPPPYPVTSVNGMTGDVIVQGGGGGDVVSVNGKTGVVVLDKTDIGLGNVANVAQYSASNPPPYPVTSVNGGTGAVTVPGFNLVQYQPNDTIDLANMIFAGYLTSSSKNIWFFIPLPKDLSLITSASLSVDTSWDARPTDGGYIVQASPLSTFGSVNCTVLSTGVRIAVESTTSSSFTNNTPVTVRAITATLTLT